MAATATARASAPARRVRTSSRYAGTKANSAPVRKLAPARKQPARRVAPQRRPGGQLIPLAVGTATAVRHLPDSGLMVRMTRGRAWIGVLGVLLVGIVALNVVTLSIAASTGKIDRDIQALDQDNSITQNRAARVLSTARIHHAGSALGLISAGDRVSYVEAGPDSVATAVRRLAAAGTG